LVTSSLEKGIVALIYAFEKQYGMSLSIEELNLSGNNIEKAGSVAIQSWFNNVKSYGRLKRLLLSSSGFNIALTPEMKLLPHLEELDISGNKVDQAEGCLNLAYVCEFSANLRKINMSKCGLTKESVEPILEAISGNIKIKEIEVIIADNSIGLKSQ
jgi:hypothetical protein